MADAEKVLDVEEHALLHEPRSSGILSSATAGVPSAATRNACADAVAKPVGPFSVMLQPVASA